MAATTISAYLGNNAFWDDPDPDYAALMNSCGDSGTNRGDCKQAILGEAVRSPITTAIILNGDEDHVDILHSPSIY